MRIAYLQARLTSSSDLSGNYPLLKPRTFLSYDRKATEFGQRILFALNFSSSYILSNCVLFSLQFLYHIVCKMAEIGLVASIFGVASFGTKVATSLYEAADIMIHAHQQIASMAKHVSQFTAILRHLGRVLEAEKGNCSKDLLHEIRKIRRSCKATFKEINGTVRSRTLRHFVPIGWLFRKAKSIELKSRLDSEQSMLQVMIHTITVSKLGDIQSKYCEPLI